MRPSPKTLLAYSALALAGLACGYWLPLAFAATEHSSPDQPRPQAELGKASPPKAPAPAIPPSADSITAATPLSAEEQNAAKEAAERKADREARWEIPKRIEDALWNDIVLTTPSKRSSNAFYKLIDAEPNRYQLYKALARQNLGADWVITSDLYAGIHSLPPQQHTDVMMEAIQQWSSQERPDLAVAWLLDHKSDPFFTTNRARFIEFLRARGAQVAPLEQVSGKN